MYYYGMPNTGYGNYGGCGCCGPVQCCNRNKGGYGYALILVLFILLVIIGASRWY